eukprot:comp9073_c0_seq1/m.4250 comp9073_c0_seq1/g.4250  ORF comp9073_c0_seq1/g.4250 comp9073_c0_seq1/m.4250 type:complete len:284 (-) comp9073_c0_seq1:161-1012(-)
MGFKVSVKAATGDKVELDLESKELKVADVKVMLEDKTKIPAGEQRLICTGHVLKDDEEIGKYLTGENVTIHLVRAAAPRPVEQAPAPQPPPAGYRGMGGMDDQEAQMMQEAMANPQTRAMIEAMLADPRALEALINSPEIANDPQALAQLRAIQQNPQMLRQVLQAIASGGVPRPRQAHRFTAIELGAALGAVMQTLGVHGPPQGPVTEEDFSNAFMNTWVALQRMVGQGVPPGAGAGAGAAGQAGQGAGAGAQARGALSGSREFVTKEFLQQCLDRAMRGTR